jgi:TolB-like protein/Tfp pilus assembly protein PilF
MGEVYRAHDPQLDRDVAIKVLSSSDPAAHTRLLREARAAAALSHPHICTIHEVNEADGQAYIAMELISGQPLESVIPAGGMTAEQVLNYGLQIVDAAAHAHDRGIVHRDLKPANTLVTPKGQIKILDFGLAKRTKQDSLQTTMTAEPLSETSVLAGTLPYMAPEQLGGDIADTRSDAWALGVMLYEMATGARPFQGRTGFELSSAILSQAPAPLPENMPGALRAVIGRCLEKEPARRYQRAGELHAALQAIQSGAIPRQPMEQTRPNPWRRVALAAAPITLAGALGLGWWATSKAPATVPIESLVVLPLDNLSGDPDQEYFVDGMHDALIGELARVGGLRVISRTSAMRFKTTGKSVPDIARELNVDAVVEGSVLKVNGRVRITVQLIEGKADRQLWADSYERDMLNVLALHAEIARAVAQRIEGTVQSQSQVLARRAGSHTPNPEAYDAYLKGRYYFAQFAGDAFKVAIQYFEGAIAKDPAFPGAYAALAHALSTVPAVLDLPRSKGAAKTALQLDPNMPEAHVALANVLRFEWDMSGSEAAFKRAIELDPNSSVAHQWYAQLLRETMRLDEALSEARRAQTLDPFSLPVRTMVGWVLFNQHRYDEALKVWDEVLTLEPEFGLAIYNQGLAYGKQGRGKEVILTAQRAAKARQRLDERLELWLLGIGYALSDQRVRANEILVDLQTHHGTAVPGLIAVLHHVLGEDEQALDWLEKSYGMRWPHLPNVTSEPWLDNLRDHPRFRALRAKMGLP